MHGACRALAPLRASGRPNPPFLLQSEPSLALEKEEPSLALERSKVASALFSLATRHSPQKGTAHRPGSDIEVLDLEGMLFDELAARLDIVTHEGGKQVISGGGVLKPDLEQGAARGIHGGLP
jgi:hypothetical protein